MVMSLVGLDIWAFCNKDPDLFMDNWRLKYDLIQIRYSIITDGVCLPVDGLMKSRELQQPTWKNGTYFPNLVIARFLNQQKQNIVAGYACTKHLKNETARNVLRLGAKTPGRGIGAKLPTRYCLPGLVVVVSTFAAKCSHCGLDCLCGLGL